LTTHPVSGVEETWIVTDTNTNTAHMLKYDVDELMFYVGLEV